MLSPQSQQVEVVGQPAQNDHNWAGNRGDAEEDELRVMLSTLADPAVREGRFVPVVLGDPIDDEERGYDDVGAQLEEELRAEGPRSNLHLEIIIQYPI